MSKPSRRRSRLGGVVRVLVVLGVVAVIGAGVVAYLLRDQPPEIDERTAPSIQAPNLMSTGGVEKSIRDRLEQRSGRTIVATCPDKVDQLKGTTFTCDVAYDDDPEVVAVADVKITGGGGQFAWTVGDE